MKRRSGVIREGPRHAHRKICRGRCRPRYSCVGDQGFVGWRKQYAKFTPASSTETLQFLAFGTLAGLPPFVLLDGVSLAVPEPSAWILLIAGFGLVGAVARRQCVAVSA